MVEGCADGLNPIMAAQAVTAIFGDMLVHEGRIDQTVTAITVVGRVPTLMAIGADESQTILPFGMGSKRET